MNPPLKVIVVKSSTTGIGWNNSYIPQLKTLVSKVHTLVTHTFAFLKYIFINELEEDNDFPLVDFSNVDFYRETFMSLIDNYELDKKKRTANLNRYKGLINKYRESYCQHCSYTPIELKYAQQIANYEAVKISTAYLNGISLQFGNRLRMFLNMVLKKKERIDTMKKEMKKQNCSESDISTAVKTITDKCTKVKIAISSKDMNAIPKDFLNSSDIDTIQDVLNSYPSNYKFAKGSIYYDCKSHPVHHLKAYYKLAYYCEVNHSKLSNCIPLRRTFIPSYMTIDTYILNTQILKNSEISNLDKDAIWSKVINMKSKAMKHQGESKKMMFRGMIYTDGIGVSVLKQNQNTKKKGGGGSRRMKVSDIEEKEFKYIEKMKKEDLQADVGKCVLIDPGRRDMLYCMHEDSTSQEKKVYRYTSNQRAKETKTRSYRKLRQNLKPDDGVATEDQLSSCSSSTVIKSKFIKYLKTKAQVSLILNNYYSNEDINLEQRGDDLLPFRKLKLSSYINRQQSDKRLVKNIRLKFGNDAVLVIGNWSAPNSRYHEPIRGIGMRRLLKKEGFKIFFLDEYRTSSICPNCDDNLETFKIVPNPRSFQRKKYTTVKCHGLLRCKSQKCLTSISAAGLSNFRLWNRDLVATLNFRRILLSLRVNGKKPECFHRRTKSLSTSSKRKGSPSIGSSSSTRKKNKSIC